MESADAESYRLYCRLNQPESRVAQPQVIKYRRMILPVFVLFCALSLLFVMEPDYSRPSITLLSLLFVSMLTIIIFRDIEMRDAANYITHFQFKFGGGGERFEPGYQLIRNLTRSISDNYQVLFGVVGAIALAIKFKAIESISPFVYGSLLVYLTNYFILHDMIQIRAGIVSGLFLFGVKFIAEQRLKPFLILTSIAICFHYSALILAPLWFVPQLKFNRVAWAAVIPFSYALALSGNTFGRLVSLIPVAQVQDLWAMYKYSAIDGVSEDVNIFNLVIIAKAVIAIYFVATLSEIECYFVHIRVWLSIFIVGIASFIIFSDVPVIAFRLSEMLTTVEIVLIPLLVYTFTNSFVGKLIVISIAFALLYVNTLYTNLLL